MYTIISSIYYYYYSRIFCNMCFHSRFNRKREYRWMFNETVECSSLESISIKYRKRREDHDG